MQSKRRNVGGRAIYRLQASPGKAIRDRGWTASLREEVPAFAQRSEQRAELPASSQEVPGSFPSTRLLIEDSAETRQQPETEASSMKQTWPPELLQDSAHEKEGGAFSLQMSPLWKQKKIDKILATDHQPREWRADVSSEDVMEEFYIAVAECQQLNHQVAERDQRISKLTHVLSSMESALIASEKQRALAERNLEEARDEIAVLRSNETQNQSEESRNEISELQKHSSSREAHVAERVKSMKTILQKLSKSELERDDARAQLHSALSLLEKQSKITAAIGEAESLSRGNSGAAAPMPAAVVPRSSHSLHDEVKALRMGSDLANKCRQDYADLGAKNKELAERVLRLEIQIESNDLDRAEPKHQSLVALEQEISGLRDELESCKVRERCLILANQDMERKLSVATDELAERRARSMGQTEHALALENRAATAEVALEELKKRAALAEQQKALLAVKANSLERFQNHVCSVAQAYGPTDWLATKRTNVQVESVLTKLQSFSLNESGSHSVQSRPHSVQPRTPGRANSSRPKWQIPPTFRKPSESR